MNKLYVGNLPYGTQDGDLRSFFSQAGEVAEANVIQDRATGRSRGFGFVTMADAAGLDQALELNGQELDGRALKINKAEQRSQSGGSRGGNGGGGFGGRR